MIGVPEPAGAGRGLEEGGGCQRLVASSLLGPAQREQQLVVPAFVAGAGEVERLQRPLVVPGRLLVGQDRQGTVAGPHRVVDGLLDIASAERALEEVVGQLGQMALGPARAHCFERVADLTVQRRAPAGRQLLVERLADETMGEHVPARRTVELLDDLCRGRLVEHLEQLHRRDVEHALQEVELELAADGRRDREGVVALG